ncbi:eukaryotic translation initiation factor 4 gamma 1-like isoform X3 [Lytechinus variegatus]|uniref:eukaryotic translation initiation factor 4 gamma 1-like isoform X3 n=1 Tax=Lytechinus variegatus TaxID=7654 RepID=UPI001BB10C86|nr:eukaryotic translation initiation factor 4 gamma 1-like isoform X3 [Lytechinus variegatus]
MSYSNPPKGKGVYFQQQPHPQRHRYPQQRADEIANRPRAFIQQQAPRPQHPVPSQSPRIPSPSVSPVAVNTLTHDMNKQGAPSRPAMAASPQQGILPNQPNPSAPPMMNMGQVRFQAPRQALPRAYQPQIPQQVYSVRHQNQAQMQGMQQHPQGGGPASQQGANQAQMMQSSAASGQYMQQQGAPQFIMTGAMTGPMNIVPQPITHRPYQQTYPTVYQAQTTPPYYSSPPQPGVWLNPAPASAPRQAFTPQPPVSRSNSTRERKLIRIQDPNTNQDITDVLLRDTSGSSSPHSGRSSANVTPPVSTSSEDAKRIQAAFASKVAMVATAGDPQSDLPPPHRVPPQSAPQQPQTQLPQQQQPPPQQVPQPIPQPVPQQPPMQPGQPPVVVMPGGQTVPVVPGGNFPVAAPGAAPVAAQLPSQPVEPAVAEGAPSTVVAATPVAEAVQPPRPVPQAAAMPAPLPVQQPAQVQPVQGTPAQHVPPEAIPAAVQPPVPVVTPAGPPANVQAAPVQEATAAAPPPPSKHELASANTASTIGQASPSEQEVAAPDGAAVPPVVPQTVAPTTETNPKQVDDDANQISANNQAVQQSTPASVVPQPESKEAASSLPESKDAKKKSQKKRFQELDKKTTKGSDEFDAYKTDDVQEPTSSQENLGKEGELEPEAKASKEPVEGTVQDVTPSEQPKETTTQPQEDKKSTEKTDDTPPSDVAKRKSEKEPSVVSEKESEQTVVPDTSAPTKVEKEEEKSDRIDPSEDRENVNEADNVESENSKNKEGKPNPKDNKMQLKYAYREDQWSPNNPEGKKQYDRDFLLQFQKGCTDKPDGLPNIPDIVLDKAVVMPLNLNQQQGGNQKSSDFMPHFMKSPRVQGKQPNYPTGQGRRSSREPLKVIQRQKDTAETKLSTSDKAWKPGHKRAPEEEKDGEDVKTQELFRNFTSILNKLTPQMFNRLTEKALQLPIDTEERLKGVIQLVFEKAISEPNFSTAYAHMCQRLSQLKVQSSTNPGQQVQFRPILLHNCQQEFEKEKQTEIDEVQRRKEISQLPAKEQEAQLELLEEKLYKAKRRTMGNIRFIGELFKLNILTENIMHGCIMKLLKAKDDDSLECLCNLMSTIGKALDHEKAKNRIDQYFNKIDKIIASQANQPRIRFLMHDLVDLRKDNWVPRRQENKPTTIDALHKEWHVNEAKKAVELKGYNGPSRSREQAPPPRTVTPQADDGWNTVPTSNKTRTPYDPSKLKLTRMTNVDENIQLGPGGRGFNMWQRGSIGAGSKNKSTTESASSSSQEEQAPSQANRFSMLSEDAKRPMSRGGSGGYSSRDSRGRGQSPMSKRSRERDRDRDREREKEAAIAEVQRISRPARPEPAEPRGSKEIAAPVKPEKKEEPTMPDSKVKHTSVATVEEFLNLKDFAEATRCVSELPSKQRHIFVQSAVDNVIEKKQDMRESVGVLFHSLLNSNLVTKEQYLTGIKDMVEFAEDMAIDIPKIYEYLGEIMGATVIERAEYLELQATAVMPLKEFQTAGVLLAEVLRTASRRIGASAVCHIWQQSGLRWETFLPDGENVQEFVQKKGVDFTLDGASATDNGLNSVQGDWVATFNRGLTNLLNEKPDNNKIFDWIKSNVTDTHKQHPEFIRALVTLICQHAAEGEGQNCRIDPEILKQRGPILQRYIDSKRPLELQALYAVQALNHSLHSPPGLLRILFDVLYDEDVVSEDAFYDWKKSEDPKESAGKGVALKSVTSFFTWLAEAD